MKQIQIKTQLEETLLSNFMGWNLLGAFTMFPRVTVECLICVLASQRLCNAYSIQPFAVLS